MAGSSSPYGTALRLRVSSRCFCVFPAVGDIQQHAEAHVLLDSEAPVVNRWRLEVPLHRRHAGRAQAERSRQQIIDGRVIRRSRSHERRRLHELQNLIVIETVVENSEPGSQRGLAVSEHVPCQDRCEARSECREYSECSRCVASCPG